MVNMSAITRAVQFQENNHQHNNQQVIQRGGAIVSTLKLILFSVIGCLIPPFGLTNNCLFIKIYNIKFYFIIFITL